MAINAGRVVVGGLIAGAIRLVFSGIAHALFLGALYKRNVGRINPSLPAVIETTSAKIGLVVINLMMGIALMYIYAAMRPRFATRGATVVSAALTAWVIASLNWAITAVMGFFTWGHVIGESLVTLPVALVAAYVGSSVYKETGGARSANASFAPPTASALG